MGGRWRCLRPSCTRAAVGAAARPRVEFALACARVTPRAWHAAAQDSTLGVDRARLARSSTPSPCHQLSASGLCARARAPRQMRLMASARRVAGSQQHRPRSTATLPRLPRPGAAHQKAAPVQHTQRLVPPPAARLRDAGTRARGWRAAAGAHALAQAGGGRAAGVAPARAAWAGSGGRRARGCRRGCAAAAAGVRGRARRQLYRARGRTRARSSPVGGDAVGVAGMGGRARRNWG